MVSSFPVERRYGGTDGRREKASKNPYNIAKREDWTPQVVHSISRKKAFLRNPEVNRIQISWIGLNLKFETFKIRKRHDVSEFIGELLMIKVSLRQEGN
ncbi:hypothetical protein Tco_0728234 [Tanacetum coccineum]|uniref:Uncharacterized protein n=1 Tax=Tanacetum coccineum TaxID=301880 RepID=A0ABQ4YNR8_9ASTR